MVKENNYNPNKKYWIIDDIIATVIIVGAMLLLWNVSIGFIFFLIGIFNTIQYLIILGIGTILIIVGLLFSRLTDNRPLYAEKNGKWIKI